MIRYVAVGALVVLLGATWVRGEEQMRLSEPRIPPIEVSAWTDGLREAAVALGGEPARPTNLAATLARHPAALRGIAPLAGYIRGDSMVPAFDQLLIALRVVWLCEANAVWAERATEARALGLSDAELRRIAEGPDGGWGRWDATLLRAADELYRDSFVSDEVWTALTRRYDAQQLMDVIFTAAEYIQLSLLVNSLGVQPDERFPDRLPVDVPRADLTARSTPVQLETPRLDPIPMNDWTDEVRQLLDPTGSGRPTLNLYATLARHPRFYVPRAVQSRYIRTGSTLPGRVREMLILRIGWLCGAEYEWAQHVRVGRAEGMTEEDFRRIAVGPDAVGWDPFEATLLRAVDELHRDDTVSNATWAALAARYDDRELIDVVITVAGYRMVSTALNALGVQLEPDRTDRFPGVAR